MNTAFPYFNLAIRRILKARAFSLIVIMTVATGLVASTVNYSYLSHILLKPLPYENGEAMFQIRHTQKEKDSPYLSVTNFEDWKRESKTTEIAAYRLAPYIVTEGDQPFRVMGIRVSSTFFSVYSVTPIVGRLFHVEEDQHGNEDVVLLGFDLWNSYFKGDRDVIGRKMSIGGKPFQIVGVLPRGYLPISEVEIYIPYGASDWERGESQRGERWARAVGRVLPGGNIKETQEEFDRIAASLREAHSTNKNAGVKIVPLKEELFGGVRPILLAMFGAGLLVLLVACANVGSLLLVDTVARRNDMAIRNALGASRWHLIKPTFVMSLVLCGAGCVVGLVLTAVCLKVLMAVAPTNIPRIQSASLSWEVLLFAVIASVFAAILSTLIPAVQVFRTNINEALKEDGRNLTSSGSRSRILSGLVILQIAVVLVLLVTALLTAKSFYRLENVALGFEPGQVYACELALPWERYSEEKQRGEFYTNLLREVSSIAPGTEFGIHHTRPFGVASSIGFEIESLPPLDPEERIQGLWNPISENYLETMGIPLLKGRDFISQDTADHPSVVIVNQALVDEYFQGKDPMGARLKLKNGIFVTIIGVSGSVRQMRLGRAPVPELYFCCKQINGPTVDLVFKVPAADQAAPIFEAIRSRLGKLDNGLAFGSLISMNRVIFESGAEARFRAVIMNSMMVLAMILALAGVHGVMSYSVAQRRMELGIRVSQGASPKQIVGLVMSRGMKITLIGIGIGIPLTLYCSRFVQEFLFEVERYDISIFAISILIVFLAGLFATYFPSKRAGRVDAAVVLRD